MADTRGIASEEKENAEMERARGEKGKRRNGEVEDTDTEFLHSALSYELKTNERIENEE